MIRFGSTEAAYRKWLKALGPVLNDDQKDRFKEIIAIARALDSAPTSTQSSQSLVEHRTRLLRQLRWVSRDLRAEVTPEATVAERNESV